MQDHGNKKRFFKVQDTGLVSTCKRSYVEFLELFLRLKEAISSFWERRGHFFKKS